MFLKEVLKFPHLKMEKRLFTYKMRLLHRIFKTFLKQNATFLSRMPLKEYINKRKYGKILPGRDKRAQIDKILERKILYKT